MKTKLGIIGQLAKPISDVIVLDADKLWNCIRSGGSIDVNQFAGYQKNT
jgi:hypothetical protein